jgi:hypothetical protein
MNSKSCVPNTGSCRRPFGQRRQEEEFTFTSVLQLHHKSDQGRIFPVRLSTSERTVDTSLLLRVLWTKAHTIMEREGTDTVLLGAQGGLWRFSRTKKVKPTSHGPIPLLVTEKSTSLSMRFRQYLQQIITHGCGLAWLSTQWSRMTKGCQSLIVGPLLALGIIPKRSDGSGSPSKREASTNPRSST